MVHGHPDPGMVLQVRKEHWKGMTDAEKAAIRETLFRQVEEKKARQQRDLEDESMQARQQQDTLHQMYEKARAIEDFNREKTRRYADFLKRQMQEKQERDVRIKALYANDVAPEYFLQFGTSHR